MVADNLKNYTSYVSLHPKFKEAFEFLKRAVSESLPVGKYEIDGDKIYAIIQEYSAKPPFECRFEGHKKYIDIQYVAFGKERVEITDISRVKSETGYDDAKDVEFYYDTNLATNLILDINDFAIFYPWDIHKPSISLGEVDELVKKIVIKIAC